MASFDITSILDFNPARFACPVCRGLIPGPKIQFVDAPNKERTFHHICPACQVRFVKGEFALGGVRLVSRAGLGDKPWR